MAISKHMFYTYKKELVRGGYMKVRRDDIASSVVRLIIEAGRSPYLFVGSGLFFVDIWALSIETAYAASRQGSGLIGLIQFTSC